MFVFLIAVVAEDLVAFFVEAFFDAEFAAFGNTTEDTGYGYAGFAVEVVFVFVFLVWTRGAAVLAENSGTVSAMGDHADWLLAVNA